MSNNRHQQEIRSVAEEAAHWLLVMKSPDTADREAFWEWLNASPLHLREILLATRVRCRLEHLDPERRIDVEALIEQARSTTPRIGEHAEPPLDRRHTAPRWFHAAAACLSLLAILGILVVTFWDGANRYSTGVGQQLVFRLEDGSTISLNTSSRLKVELSEQARDIYLEEGQALFEVKRDPSRPFRVHTLNSVVEAVGTQFDVRVLSDRTMVAVIEGVVKVDQAETGTAVATTQPAQLDAGEAITIDAVGTVGQPSKIDVATVSAWKQQRLVFDDATLEWIVNEFNRYNAQPKLKLEGEKLAARRFNGLFNAHRPDALIEYLQRDSTLEFVRTEQTIVIRETSVPSSPANADIGSGTRTNRDGGADGQAVDALVGDR